MIKNIKNIINSSSFVQFLNKFFNRFGVLILKLVGSRKAFFQIISKSLAIYLILRLGNELYIVSIFLWSSIENFVYFKYLKFEDVKTEVKVGINK